MSNQNTVIVGDVTADDPHAGRCFRVFWTGRHWTPEYPEAKLYTVSDARRVTKTTSFDRVVHMIVDYGIEGEHAAL